MKSVNAIELISPSDYNSGEWLSSRVICNVLRDLWQKRFLESSRQLAAVAKSPRRLLPR